MRDLMKVSGEDFASDLAARKQNLLHSARKRSLQYYFILLCIFVCVIILTESQT